MIQRVQSVFLLLVAAISAILLVVPVYELYDIGQVAASETGQTIKIPGNALLMILNYAIGVIALVTIILYKLRKIQIRLCNLGLLLTCLLIGLLFFSADTVSSSMNKRVVYLYGSYLPMLELIFLFLASRFIKKDEALVKSADRLR